MTVRRRADSAALIVATVAVAFILSPFGVVLLALTLAWLSGREVERLLAASGRPVIGWAIATGGTVIVLAAGVVALLQPPLGFVDGPLPAWSWVPVPGIVAAASGILALRREEAAVAYATWEACAFGAIYVGLLAFAVALVGVWVPSTAGCSAGEGLLCLDVNYVPHDWKVILANGRGWPLALIAAVWSFDTGAYLVGRAIGRRPFFARISPSKTVEGFVGGVVVATVVVVIAVGALGRPAWEGLIMGPLLAVAAQAGDLAESALKRAAGAKDSGTLIPGHGGVLDRIDSFLFAAPVMAAYAVLAIPRLP